MLFLVYPKNRKYFLKGKIDQLDLHEEILYDVLLLFLNICVKFTG